MAANTSRQLGYVSYVDVDLSRRSRRVAMVTIPAARIHGCSPEASSPRHGGSAGPHLASTHWRAGPGGFSGERGWPESRTAWGCWCQTPHWTGRSPPGLSDTRWGFSAYLELKSQGRIPFLKILFSRENRQFQEKTVQEVREHSLSVTCSNRKNNVTMQIINNRNSNRKNVWNKTDWAETLLFSLSRGISEE